jgi:hypothetical protein
MCLVSLCLSLLSVCLQKPLSHSMIGCPTQRLCKCNGFGFRNSDEHNSCVTCPDPCAADPCGTRSHPGNQCELQRRAGACPTYTCLCDYPRFVPLESGFGCTACEDTCSENSCALEENNLNRCIIARLPDDGPQDCPGAHMCSCNGYGFALPPSLLHCLDRPLIPHLSWERMRNSGVGSLHPHRMMTNL